MQKIRSVWYQEESDRELRERIQNSGKKKKQKCDLEPSALLALITTFQQNYQLLSQLSARGNAKKSRPLLPCTTERPAAIFVWFVPGIRVFLAKAVYIGPGSSYLKIPELGRS